MRVEKDLLRVVDALPGLVLTGHGNGKVEFLNRGWEDYTGLNAGEGSGLGWHAAVYPDDILKLEECARSVLATGGVAEAETRLRRKDGVYRWFLFRSFPIRDPLGLVVRWCGCFTDIDERRRTAERLGAREAQCVSIADSVPGLIAVMSPTGEVESVNRHVLDYFGMKLEDLKSWTTVFAVHPDDLAEVIAAWTRSVQTEEPYEIEHRMRRADGVYRWFHARALPLRDSEGRVTRWHCLQTDINDRKRVEALLAGEKRLLELIATTEDSLAAALMALCELAEELCPTCVPCAIVRLDPQIGRLKRVASVGFSEVLIDYMEGLTISPEAFRGRGVQGLSPEFPNRSGDGYLKALLPVRVKSCFVIPDTSSNSEDSKHLAIFSSEPRNLDRHDQEVMTRIVHLANIAVAREHSQSSLARAHNELKQSEGRLRTIINTSPGLVWTTAPDGSAEFLNRQWLDFAGVRLKEARGLGWQSIIHPDDASRLLVYWQELLESGQPGETEARLRRFDGSYVWFLMRTAPLRNEAGQITQWFGQNTDINDRKQAESLLEEEKRLLEMMAGGLSIAQLLGALCQFVESVASGCYCSVMAADPSGLQFERGVSPGFPLNFVTTLIGQPIEVESSPGASAAYRSEQFVAADLTTERRWDATWRSMVLAKGLRACWAAPISSAGGQILGAFAIYYSDPRTPGAAHRGLIDRFTQIARIAMERDRNDTALKRSKEALAASEGNLSLIVNTMPGLAASARADGSLEFLNQNYLDYLKISSEEAVRLRWDYAVHPDCVEGRILMGRSAARPGGVSEAELRLRRFDGIYRCFLNRTTPFRDASGTIVKWVGATSILTTGSAPRKNYAIRRGSSRVWIAY